MTVFLSPERGVRPIAEVSDAITKLLDSGVVSKCVIDPTGIGGPIADKLKKDGFRVITAYLSQWKEVL